MGIAAIKKVTSAGVTLATSTDNQVATVTGANALTGESNLTFDGTDLAVGNAAPSSYIDSVHGVIVGDTGDATSEIVVATSTSGVGEINFTDTADTTNQGQISYDHSAGVMTVSNAAGSNTTTFDGTSFTVKSATTAAWNPDSTFGTLHVNNAGTDTDQQFAGIYFTVGSGGSDGQARIDCIHNGTGSQGDLAFATRNSSGNVLEALRILNNQHIYMGDGGLDTAIFSLLDSENNIMTFLRCTNASFTNTTLRCDATRSASSAYALIDCYSGASSDVEFKLRGDGNAYADGSWNGSGADYQEYFESQSGVAAEVGRTVVLDGGQIRYYNAATDSADDIIGVTRPEADNKNSAVVGNLAWNHWTDKYLTDDWGVYEREDITVYQWEVEKVTHTVQQYSSLWHYSHGTVSEYVPVGSVTIPADAVQTTDNVRKLNPAYDPAQEENYQSREDRDEWWLIGLLGQIQIKAGEPTNPRWIKMKDISANVELWYVR